MAAAKARPSRASHGMKQNIWRYPSVLGFKQKETAKNFIRSIENNPYISFSSFSFGIGYLLGDSTILGSFILCVSIYFGKVVNMSWIIEKEWLNQNVNIHNEYCKILVSYIKYFSWFFKDNNPLSGLFFKHWNVRLCLNAIILKLLKIKV